MVNSIYSSTVVSLMLLMSSALFMNDNAQNILSIKIKEPKAISKLLKDRPKLINSFETIVETDLETKSIQLKNALHAKVDNAKIAYVLKQSEKMGLPPAVALVPMVESKYKNNAVSNKGAGGAWQLMPKTAKQYGIKASERFNFKAATNAALTMLKELHTQFKSWALTFAAYNAGPNKVLKALASHPHAKSIDQLGLPKETKNYVKKIAHLAKISKIQGVSASL
ncbi:MAG: lytic transglycosylase domain-containing protein [Gammaproteobacteria bacterium]